jgi:pilus assembly protein CpaC
MVTVGKSLIIDSPLNIIRVHVSNGDLAEAVAVNPREVLINGKAPGETSLIVWQQNGARIVYDLTIRMSGLKLDAARQQILREFPSESIQLTFENDTAFVRGTVKDVIAAERVISIAESLGKAVNLLNVEVPPVDPQVLLRVRFANVDRQASSELGMNFWNSSFNQQTSLGTGPAIFPDDAGRFQVPQAVNILLLRPDINLVAQIQALESRRVLELLAEPNLLAISGEEASFLAGGEFPVPVVQPSQGAAVITIMWREYGIRLNFQPTVTPRGTIRLKVAPEVSSLNYTNSVTVLGVTVPGLSSRRVQTEVELDSGQSFVIAGLLDNQARDSLSKVPGISSIPVLGKLFQSRTVSREKGELLVIITPELVRPLPAGQAPPELTFPTPLLEEGLKAAPRHPGMEQTGPVPVKPPVDTVPFERLVPKPGAPQGPTPATIQIVAPPAGNGQGAAPDTASKGNGK